jgi:MYXO-CTERM domain-containing protein
MKATAKLWSFGILALVSAVGCGGSSSPGASGAPVPLAQLPGLWAQTVCAQNFKCASQADIQVNMPSPPNSQSSCVTNNTMLWQLLVASVEDGQSKGRVVYDPAQEGTCLATLAHETCADWTTGLAHDVGCPEAYTPKVAVGGVCASDVECIAGFCDGADATMTPPKDGACKARIAHGAACAFGDTCVATDYCDGTAMMCVTKKPGGAACASSDECGNSCNGDTSKCSGYAGCSVAPVTTRGTLLSLMVVGLVAFAARRRRRSGPPT